MAKNQELELSILIGGHVDNSLAQAVKLANTQIGSIANGASKFAENIAKGAVAAAGGIAAAVVDTTKESVSFESEMLDVTKYVSGLTDDSGKVIRSNYEEMSKDILDLSTDIPYTAEELTRLAAAAGQSGKSMDDLISDGFLRDVAEMGTAMDISADQAGDWAAKWEVAFDINHDQVMELADQINYLGAHYATTAAEIAQTVNDTGSLGQIAGMDVASTAALSTALLAMGVDSGKVATSIRRMYTNLSMGSKATDAQAAAFEQLGFTAEQFAKDELRGTKLDFADGTLTMNLAKYQRDYPVTKTITGDAEGNLLIDGSDSRFYVAEVEIPAIEYEDVEVEGEAENATMTEAVEGETEAAEDTTAEDTAHKTHIERKAKPLNTDDVTLRLWSIEDFDIL